MVATKRSLTQFKQAADIIKAANRYDASPESVTSGSAFSTSAVSSSSTDVWIMSPLQSGETPLSVEVVTVFQTKTVYV